MSFFSFSLLSDSCIEPHLIIQSLELEGTSASQVIAMLGPRKLVTLRRITKVRRFPGRYKSYDLVTVDSGWTVVVYHDDFCVNDLIVYFEIDSFIPTTSCRFTWQQDSKMTEFRGQKGYHVRSQILGKQISQGLVQSIAALPEIETFLQKLTEDHGEQRALTLAQEIAFDDIVGVKKWEVPVEARRKILGRVPSFFPRPACDRVQNIKGLFSTSKHLNATFQVTEKLDGLSMTVYQVEIGSKWHKSLPELPPGSPGCILGSPTVRIGVASAGEELDERGNDMYWQAAKHLNLPTTIHNIGPKNVAVQGELIGPGIKNNSLKFPDNAPHEFVIFGIFDIDKQCLIDPRTVVRLCTEMGWPHVPVIGYFRLRDFATNMQEILGKADGEGFLGQTREGFVFKSIREEFSFKVISNQWLIEKGE